MNKYIKEALDNFDLNLLNEMELNKYKSCKIQMSKRAALLHLIDNLKNLTYDLNELKNIINNNEKI